MKEYKHEKLEILPKLKIVIIGGGFSGICAAIKLQQQLGIHDYVIVDENVDFGGVWLVNTYPGCAVDAPGFFYSYSFQLNPNWSCPYPSQPEVLEYVQSVCRNHDLYVKAKFNHRIKNAAWDDGKGKWLCTIIKNNLVGEEEFAEFDIVIACVGQLRVPHIPEEFNTFQGPKIHSARWDKDVTLENKKIAIVGAGASAIQIIPKMANVAESLVVYQRSAPWVFPRGNFHIPSWLKWMFAKMPFLLKFIYCMLWLVNDLLQSWYFKDSILSKMAKKCGGLYIKLALWKWDNKVVQEMTPKYPVGCKRPLLSDAFYSSLKKPNVKLVRDKITKVKSNSIVTEDVNEAHFDVLILATGFRVSDFFAPMEITGKNGVNILDVWKNKGPSTYLGTCTSTMPNLFCIIGPNASPFTSLIFTAECQVDFTCKVLKEMMHRGSFVVVVDGEAEKQDMKEISAILERTVWSVDCGTFYRDEEGRIIGPRPVTAWNYWRKTRRPNFNHFRFN